MSTLEKLLGYSLIGCLIYVIVISTSARDRRIEKIITPCMKTQDVNACIEHATGYKRDGKKLH